MGTSIFGPISDSPEGGWEKGEGEGKGEGAGEVERKFSGIHFGWYQKVEPKSA